MADEPTEPTEDQGQQAGTATPPGQEETARTFSQDQVNELMGKTRRQAEKAATAKILETLGVDSIDSVAETLKAQREREEQELGEIEKARREAEQARQEADKAKAEAAQRTLRADLSVALGKGQPINPDRLEMALAVAIPHASSLTEAEDPITETVEWVRGQSPEWFQTSTEPTPQGNGSTPPPSASHRPPAQQAGSSDPGSTARSRYEEWKAKRGGGPNLPQLKD